MFAAHRKLDNLCLLIDNNGLQIDGKISEVCSPYPIDEKFRAFGFHVIVINGHNFDEIEAAYEEAKTVKGKPTAIISLSIKGKDVTFMEDRVEWHGAAPNEEQYQIAMNDLNAILNSIKE